MSGAAQLPFDLPLRPALGREDFLIAPCNEVAFALIDSWPDWPGPALALSGPPGSGKTHLGQIWRSAAGAVEIEAAALAASAPPDLLGAARLCLLDDADAALAGGGAPEEAMLHLYNLVSERGGHLLFTGRNAPSRWPVRLPDLRSRLRAASVAIMAAPDDAMIEAVLVKLFADRQLRVEAPVVRFLLARMERTFAAARSIAAALDRAALADQREITVPLARRVLAEAPSVAADG